MGYTGPLKPNPADGEATIYNYGYRPSLAMGVVGIITFFIPLLGHLWWFIKKRGTRSFHGLMAVACVLEVLGYGARITSHKWPYAGMGFLCSTYCIQAATILFTAAVYKVVTRIIKYAPEGRGRSLTPMRPRSMLTLFIIFDTLMVIFQIAGVYLAAGAESSKHDDDDADPMLSAGMSGLLYVAGTVVQTITWLVFLGIFVCIARRTTRFMLALGANSATAVPRFIPLTKLIYVTWFLFFIRLIFRLAQAAQGQWEYAGTHEFLFAIFEYLPMLLAIGLWAAVPLTGFLFPDGVHPKSRGEHHMNLDGNGSADQTGVAPSTVASTHAGEKV